MLHIWLHSHQICCKLPGSQMRGGTACPATKGEVALNPKYEWIFWLKRGFFYPFKSIWNRIVSKRESYRRFCNMASQHNVYECSSYYAVIKYVCVCVAAHHSLHSARHGLWLADRREREPERKSACYIPGAAQLKSTFGHLYTHTHACTCVWASILLKPWAYFIVFSKSHSLTFVTPPQ